MPDSGKIKAVGKPNTLRMQHGSLLPHESLGNPERLGEFWQITPISCLPGSRLHGSCFHNSSFWTDDGVDGSYALRTLLSVSQRRGPEVGFGDIAIDVSEAFWTVSDLPTILLLLAEAY